MIHILIGCNDTVWATRMRAAIESTGSRATSSLARSGQISSRQDTVHPRLEQVLRRHLETDWLQPYHSPTVENFRRLVSLSDLSAGRPFILDSGCGTGKSTVELARQFPGHLVIGVDRSATRLAKSSMQNSLVQRGNCVLVRAELATFWRLLLAAACLPERHFLFYPNPWPKPKHLQRRWHGHPVFPQLLALGGEIELRCNWEIYAREFAFAVSIATGHDLRAQPLQDVTGVSPFETKYNQRGQPLFCVRVPKRVTTAFRHTSRGVLTQKNLLSGNSTGAKRHPGQIRLY